MTVPPPQSPPIDVGEERSGRPWRMRDVAKLAQVSHQTVSRVFNAPDKVRPDTRQKVMDAVAALHYRPSAAARALTTQRSGVIGLIDSGMDLPGTAHLLRSVESAARCRGYATSVTLIEDGSVDAVRASFQHLLDQEVEGIIVIGSTRELASAAHRVGPTLPLALLSAYRSADTTIAHISVDSFSAAAQATRHLICQGRRRIAHISGPSDWIEVEDRIGGWRQALNEAQLPSTALFEGTWLPASGYEAGQAILEQGDIDAVFTANDHMALGLICALAEKGVRVPDDIAVVGFDDIFEAAYLNPPLTTMRQPFSELGAQTVEQILQMIDGAQPRHISLEAQLIVRRSSTSALAH